MARHPEQFEQTATACNIESGEFSRSTMCGSPRRLRPDSTKITTALVIEDECVLAGIAVGSLHSALFW